MLICIFASVSSVLGCWCEILKERIFMLLCMCALYINSKLFCFWAGLHNKLSSEFWGILTLYFDCENPGQVHEMSDFLKFLLVRDMFIFRICIFPEVTQIYYSITIKHYGDVPIHSYCLTVNWAIPAMLWWIMYVFPKSVCYYTLEPYSFLSYLKISEA